MGWASRSPVPLQLQSEASSDVSSEAIFRTPLHKAKFLSLEGRVLAKGNRRTAKGDIAAVETPLLQLVRSKAKDSPVKGTILLLPGGGYETLHLGPESPHAAPDSLNSGPEAQGMVRFLNQYGFDVALLEYRVGKGSEARDLALADALKAYRLLKLNPESFGLQGTYLAIMGCASGGHLAARAVMNLSTEEQPQDLLLLAPLYMHETAANSVFPVIFPPFAPRAKLFAACLAGQEKVSVRACEEYVKSWKGFDGAATFQLLAHHSSLPQAGGGEQPGGDSSARRPQLDSLLRLFFAQGPPVPDLKVNPAALPVAGGNRGRHAEKLALVAKNRYDLIFIGNSITHNFEKGQYQPVWNQFYAPRNALNFGYSGYRTENLLWNIDNGELEGQTPKVIVLEIGTNNIDEKNYPLRHTAGQLAGGIEAIVLRLREKCPDAKIVVMRCFPGCYGGPNPTSHRAILERASNEVSKLADGKHIFYCDVNHVFLNMDGSINQAAMPDWLHPGPSAAKAWAQAMEPLISELMGDKSLDTEIPANSAIVPVSKLENDSYDWWARHAEVLRVKDSINPEIVLIGNSITHFWGGAAPPLVDANGRPRQPNGPKAWESVFGPYRVLNLGFGWDRTQNVLWRLDHGQLDRLNPRLVVIHIGTNNTSETRNARMNTASEIVEGIAAICLRVRSKVPHAKIVLMQVFPREESPTHPRRVLIGQINSELVRFAQQHNFPLIDLAPQMLSPDGTLSREMAPDYCHPSEKGYAIWAELLRAYLP